MRVVKPFIKVVLVTSVAFIEGRARILDRLLQLFQQVFMVFPDLWKSVIVVMEGKLRWWTRQDEIEWFRTGGAITVYVVRVREGFSMFVPILCVTVNVRRKYRGDRTIEAF